MWRKGSKGGAGAPFPGRAVCGTTSAGPGTHLHHLRAEDVHAQWQGNRNPFIDHPEGATAAWSESNLPSPARA